MNMHYIRRGSGKPLLLVHGLGGSWESWTTVLDSLAEEREVVAVDLPGFGKTPPLAGEVSIRTLGDALTSFLAAHDLIGVDSVGSSMGARLVLELARRGGVLGRVVSLNPGGFWSGWQRHYFYASIWASIRVVRLLQPAISKIAASRVGRTLLLPQISARPWDLPPDLVLKEIRSYAASPSFDALLYDLAYGETQQGAPAGTLEHRVVIGWGRHDRVCLPSQARRARRLFPDARLHWFEHSGHFPHWDVPGAAVGLILATVSEEPGVVEDRHALAGGMGAARSTQFVSESRTLMNVQARR
jgi:pimeloyl-ACP methyl ester carboxylesterase